MCLTAQDINRIIGITESFQLPDKLMQILKSQSDRERVFTEFLQIEQDLSFDWFTDYFQEQHSNRDNMMQDFTPKSITGLLRDIIPGFTHCADICAGTGGLTIAMHEREPGARFYCVELSERAFPLLLFNLCIRNMDAVAVRGDILTQENFETYQITPGEQFGRLARLEEPPEFMADVVVMNPPYSVKHKWDEKHPDARFEGYGFPPSQFSDYAFIMHGLSMLKESGMIAAIVPHGLLFRGNKEAAIRRAIIERKQLSGIIGLPENLFLNTGIPVCVMTFQKSGVDGDLFFVDASKEFEKDGKLNRIPEDKRKRIADVFLKREDVEKFSHLASQKEIEENEYNLNIPRYVDTYEPPEEIDIVKVSQEIAECSLEIRKLDIEILNALKNMKGCCAAKDRELKKAAKIWEDMVNGYAQLTLQTDGTVGNR